MLIFKCFKCMKCDQWPFVYTTITRKLHWAFLLASTIFLFATFISTYSFLVLFFWLSIFRFKSVRLRIQRNTSRVTKENARKNINHAGFVDPSLGNETSPLKYEKRPLLPRCVHTSISWLWQQSLRGLTPSHTLSSQSSSTKATYLHTDVETSLSPTLKAAPPWMTDLIKIPRSVPVSRDLFPFKLTPRPAEPESFRGISKVSWSVVSRQRAWQSGSPFWRGKAHEKSEGKKAG